MKIQTGQNIKNLHKTTILWIRINIIGLFIFSTTIAINVKKTPSDSDEKKTFQSHWTEYQQCSTTTSAMKSFSTTFSSSGILLYQNHNNKNHVNDKTIARNKTTRLPFSSNLVCSSFFSCVKWLAFW